MAKSKFIIGLLTISLFLAVSAKLKVNPETKQFVDDQGNVRVFHGVNVAYKIPPFLPPTVDHFDFDKSFSEDDAIRLKSWGMNIIRLTLYWEAIEPARGHYSEAYLDKVQELVDICAKYDIAVYLDMHQDVANKQYCGEGMPDWAVRPHTSFLTKFPAPLWGISMEYDADGYPTLKSCLERDFGVYYATYAVMDAYQDLWDNWNGIGDAFADMWAHVADRFKDKQNVIGYEIINEPFIGNIFKDPRIVFKNDKVMPFYHKVHEKIRAVDDETIIFYEHPTTDQVFHAVHGSPGGPAYNDRQVLSYHIYPVTSGDPTDVKSANIKASILFDHAYSILDSENQMGFLTEFGAISGLTSPGNDNMKFVLDIADKRIQSWSYWQYKFYDDYTTAARPSECEGFFDGNGNLIVDKIKVLTRAYVQSSPLQIVKMSSDFLNKLYVQFNKSVDSSNGLIKLYLNEEHHFKKGVICKVNECATCTVQRANGEEKHHFYLDHSSAGPGTLTLTCKTNW